MQPQKVTANTPKAVVQSTAPPNASPLANTSHQLTQDGWRLSPGSVLLLPTLSATSICSLGMGTRLCRTSGSSMATTRCPQGQRTEPLEAVRHLETRSWSLQCGTGLRHAQHPRVLTHSKQERRRKDADAGSSELPQITLPSSHGSVHPLQGPRVRHSLPPPFSGALPSGCSTRGYLGSQLKF